MRRVDVLAFGVVVLAAVVRLWNLGGQPVIFFDSGVYLGEGAFLASAAERATSAIFQPPNSALVALPSAQATSPLERLALTLEDGTDAHPPDIAKPGHAVLLALAMLLLGKTALAGALVSAVAGIGTVALIYAIGQMGWGRLVALTSAVLLAVSGQHLAYSREPLVEADGLFFATLAALLYLRARGARGLLVAGLVWGIAFTCNNRLSYLPAVVCIAELAAWSGWRVFVKRGALMMAGFVAPLALLEAAYVVARAVGQAARARTDWLDYVQQLAAFGRMNPPDRLRFDQWPTFFVDLALTDGLPLVGLVLVGAIAIARRMRWGRGLSRADLLLIGSLAVPLALYSFYSTGEVRFRHFSLAIPWVMLAAAIGLRALARSFGARREPVVVALGCSLVVLLAIPRVTALDSAPSGMPAVLAAVGDRRAASTNGPVFGFYAGEDRTNARLREAFVNGPADLRSLSVTYRLLVVDMQAYVFAGDLTDRYARATPVLAVPNGNDAWYLADLLEHYGSSLTSWSDLLAKWHANRAAASELRVYDLPGLLQPGD